MYLGATFYVFMITSTASKQVKRIEKLQKKAKARREEGVFIAEGPKMVKETPKELLQEIYVAESYEDTWDGEVTEVVSDSIMRQISDTKTPQGVLAIVTMPSYDLGELLAQDEPRLLLIEGVQDPGNLGTIFRTAEGAGMSGIVMSKETVDLFHPKVVRATMGSLYRMPFVISSDWMETLEEIKAAGVTLFAAHLKGEKYYNEFDYTRACGFLIGNEGSGLTEETVRVADALVRIPMEGEVESLNAAMAAGILMYESYRQRR